MLDSKLTVAVLSQLAAAIRDGLYDPPPDVRVAVAKVNAAVAERARGPLRQVG